MWKSLIDTMYSFSVNFNHVERIRLLYKAKNTTAKKRIITIYTQWLGSFLLIQHNIT